MRIQFKEVSFALWLLRLLAGRRRLLSGVFEGVLHGGYVVVLVEFFLSNRHSLLSCLLSLGLSFGWLSLLQLLHLFLSFLSFCLLLLPSPLILLFQRKIFLIYKKALLFIHYMASAISSEYVFEVIIRHIKFLLFEEGFDLLHLLETVGWILQVDQHLMSDFFLVFRAIINQLHIIIAFRLAIAALNIKVGTDLIITVGRVLIELNLLYLRHWRLIAFDSGETYSLYWLAQSSLWVLLIFDVDLSLIDRGNRRMELVNYHLERGVSLRMCKAQIHAFSGSGLIANRLQLINDEFALVLTDVGRQALSWQAPEEVLGNQVVKFTHWSQSNISLIDYYLSKWANQQKYIYRMRYQVMKNIDEMGFSSCLNESMMRLLPTQPYNLQICLANSRFATFQTLIYTQYMIDKFIQMLVQWMINIQSIIIL